MADKTEKPTPKRLEEARKKGQVAKSADLNGAVVMTVGLFVLGSAVPGLVSNVHDAMMEALGQVADPSVVSIGGVGTILMLMGKHIVLAVAPIALACCLTGVLVNVAQVGLRPNLSALKPKPQKLNPAAGLKNVYGKQSLVELAKSLTKVSVVAAIVGLSVVPQVGTFGAMVGIGPLEFGSQAAGLVLSIAKRAAFAYLFVGVCDYLWQRKKHNKSLRMDKQEVKDEAKQQQLPAEVRGAMRRRQMSNARARMMAAVPTADVVVTNPTHFSVALKYDGTKPAPEVVAKGQDLIALRIRELARDAGVPVLPNPPLARSLHATVEVGQQIPEELFAAVAQVLAYVYRIAASRRAQAA
jgi:flagellar biosynthetic protein FlhB